MKEEKAVLNAIAEGDVNAFSTLFYAYHQQLGLYVFNITKSQEIAEEVVQDVFLKIWQKRDKLVTVNNINAYLYTIAKNETLNAIRKIANERRRRQQFDQEILTTDTLFATADSREEEGLEQVFENAVSSLPPQQQKVFLLRQQGFKNAQIALQMQISPHSAKKYQQLALQAIEKFLRAKAVIISIIFIFFKNL